MITQARRRIVWTSRAEQDLKDAALWYGDQEPALDQPFLAAVREAATKAAEAPPIHARVYKDLRRVLVHRFPYGLIFREQPSELIVLACYHLHRDPSVWQSRA